MAHTIDPTQKIFDLISAQHLWNVVLVSFCAGYLISLMVRKISETYGKDISKFVPWLLGLIFALWGLSHVNMSELMNDTQGSMQGFFHLSGK